MSSQDAAGGAPTGKKVDTVYIILLENLNWAKVHGDTKDWPWVNKMADAYSYADNYVTGMHPSLKNYLVLESGDTYGQNALSATATKLPGPFKGTHLTTLINGAGKTAKYWMEVGSTLDPKGVCGLNARETGNGGYSPDHNIPVMFDDVTGTPAQPNTAECKKNVGLMSEMAAGLMGGTEVNYNFIVPTNEHQGEEPGAFAFTKVDMFIQQLVETQIMATSPAWKRGSAVIFLLWDECSFTGPAKEAAGGEPSGLIAISPNAKKGSVKTAYNHLSMVKTIAKIFGVTPPAPASGAKPNYDGAMDLSDMFAPGTLF
jgi:hypothetical protein